MTEGNQEKDGPEEINILVKCVVGLGCTVAGTLIGAGLGTATGAAVLGPPGALIGFWGGMAFGAKTGYDLATRKKSE